MLALHSRLLPLSLPLVCTPLTLRASLYRSPLPPLSLRLSPASLSGSSQGTFLPISRTPPLLSSLPTRSLPAALSAPPRFLPLRLFLPLPVSASPLSSGLLLLPPHSSTLYPSLLSMLFALLLSPSLLLAPPPSLPISRLTLLQDQGAPLRSSPSSG